MGNAHSSRSSYSRVHDDVIIEIESNQPEIAPSEHQPNNRSNNRSIYRSNHQSNKQSSEHEKLLIETLTYILALPIAAQVSREWYHAARKAAKLIDRSIHQKETQPATQQIDQSITQTIDRSVSKSMINPSIHHHTLAVAPDHYDVFLSHIKALKRAQLSHATNSSCAYRATHLTLIELEYDESISSCFSRVTRGLPALMTMHEALEIVIQHAPCQSNDQSNNQSNEQSMWPSIVSLTLVTLDDHRTIQAPRLRALLKTMPSLTELHITSKSARRPVLKQPTPPNNQTNCYVHRNEQAYQKQLLGLIMSQKLTELTLPVWMSDDALVDIHQTIRDTSDRFLILTTLTHFQLEHRNEYFNQSNNQSVIRNNGVIEFVSALPKLRSVSLCGMFVDSTSATSMIHDCPEIQHIGWRYVKYDGPVDVIQQAFMQPRRINSICFDSCLKPESLVHVELVELSDVHIGSLNESILLNLPQLRALGLTCRTQQQVSCSTMPPLCTKQVFIDQIAIMSSEPHNQTINHPINHPISHNLHKLSIRHLSYERLVDLLRIHWPALEGLDLSFDSSTLNLANDWIVCDGQRILSVDTFGVPNITPRTEGQPARPQWPKLTTLVLEATHISSRMLALTSLAPQLTSVTLRQIEQKHSAFKWESECEQSGKDATNMQLMMTDEHLIIFSHCHSLSSIVFEGCNQLTARALIALSFVGSLQSVAFMQCHGMSYQLVAELIQSHSHVEIGHDSHPRMSALDILTFIDCSDMRSELPLGLPQQLRHSMTQWSMQRMSHTSNQSINQSVNQSNHRKVQLGSCKLSVADDNGLVAIKLTDQEHNRVVCATANLTNGRVPSAMLFVVRHKVDWFDHFKHYFIFGCLLLDRFDLLIPPSFQSPATSHHEWQPTTRQRIYYLTFFLSLPCAILFHNVTYPDSFFEWMLIPPIFLTLYYEKRMSWSWDQGYDVEPDTNSDNVTLHRVMKLMRQFVERLVPICVFILSFCFLIYGGDSDTYG